MNSNTQTRRPKPPQSARPKSVLPIGPPRPPGAGYIQSESKPGSQPAFPVPEVEIDGISHSARHKGLTVRQFYAATFAAAWIAVLERRRGEPGYDDTAAAIESNRLGLRQADAMLAAEKEPQ